MRRVKLILLAWLVKDYFKGIMADDLLQAKLIKGKVKFYHKGKVLEDDKVSAIQENAKTVSQSLIWKILMEECEYQAEDRMFRKATNSDDMFFGKAMLYLTNVLKKKMEYITDLKKNEEKRLLHNLKR